MITLPPHVRITAKSYIPTSVRDMLQKGKSLSELILETEASIPKNHKSWKPLKVTHFAREMLRLQTRQNDSPYREEGIITLKAAIVLHNLLGGSHTGNQEWEFPDGSTKAFVYWVIKGNLTCCFNISKSITSHDTSISVNRDAMPEAIWHGYLEKYYRFQSGKSDQTALDGIRASNFFMLGDYNPDEGLTGSPHMVSKNFGDDLIFEFTPKTYSAKRLLRELEREVAKNRREDK